MFYLQKNETKGKKKTNKLTQLGSNYVQVSYRALSSWLTDWWDQLKLVSSV